MTKEIKLPGFAKASDVFNNKIVLGLRNGKIAEVDLNTSEVSVVMVGHSDGETWGLAIDETTGYVITSGDDNKILVFDPAAKKTVFQGIVDPVAGPKKKIGGASTLSVFPPNQCSRAVAINTKTGHVAVGCNNGTLYIREGFKNLDKTIAKNNNAKE